MSKLAPKSCPILDYQTPFSRSVKGLFNPYNKNPSEAKAANHGNRLLPYER